MLALMLSYLFAGLFFISFSIPLILRRIPPNDWYGLRIPQTLDNPEVWYAANAYAARGLIISSSLTVVMALLLYFIPVVDEITYLIVMTILLLGGLFVNLITAIRYAMDMVKK